MKVGPKEKVFLLETQSKLLQVNKNISKCGLKTTQCVKAKGFPLGYGELTLLEWTVQIPHLMLFEVAQNKIQANVQHYMIGRHYKPEFLCKFGKCHIKCLLAHSLHKYEYVLSKNDSYIGYNAMCT